VPGLLLRPRPAAGPDARRRGVGARGRPQLPEGRPDRQRRVDGPTLVRAGRRPAGAAGGGTEAWGGERWGVPPTGGEGRPVPAHGPGARRAGGRRGAPHRRRAARCPARGPVAEHLAGGDRAPRLRPAAGRRRGGIAARRADSARAAGPVTGGGGGITTTTRGLNGANGVRDLPERPGRELGSEGPCGFPSPPPDSPPQSSRPFSLPL